MDSIGLWIIAGVVSLSLAIPVGLVLYLAYQTCVAISERPMLLSPTVLLVLVVVGLVYVFYTFTSGRAKHGEVVQAKLALDELRASNPEYKFSVDEFRDGTIAFTHDVIGAIGIFDPDKKLLRLKSADREDSTEDCQSQEEAETAVEDYLRRICDPNPAE